MCQDYKFEDLLLIPNENKKLSRTFEANDTNLE